MDKYNIKNAMGFSYFQTPYEILCHQIEKGGKSENSILNLLEDWNESKKDIYAVADFHQKFEHIHPFIPIIKQVSDEVD